MFRWTCPTGNDRSRARAAVRARRWRFHARGAPTKRAQRRSSSAAAGRVSLVASEEVPMKTKSKVKAGTSHRPAEPVERPARRGARRFSLRHCRGQCCGPMCVGPGACPDGRAGTRSRAITSLAGGGGKVRHFYDSTGRGAREAVSAASPGQPAPPLRQRLFERLRGHDFRVIAHAQQLTDDAAFARARPPGARGAPLGMTRRRCIDRRTGRRRRSGPPRAAQPRRSSARVRRRTGRSGFNRVRAPTSWNSRRNFPAAGLRGGGRHAAAGLYRGPRASM